MSEVMFVTPVKKEFFEQYEYVADFFYNNNSKVKKPSKFDKLKKQFSEKNIGTKLLKYLALPVLLGGLFLAFKDSFVEWASGLWETIKTKFDEFVQNIKQWFNEVVTPIIDKVKGFILLW